MTEHLTANKKPPAIVVGLDSHQGIQTARDLLRTWYHILLPDEAVVERLMDKIQHLDRFS